MNILYIIFAGSIFLGCNSGGTLQSANTMKEIMDTNKNIVDGAKDSVIVGGGCFWCTEAQFLMLDGVEKVVSGYAGGSVDNPTYKQVCTGTTGHAEVIKIVYDTKKLNFADVLFAFFQSHDPTELNRQGADVGTQYRSAIFYSNENEKKSAEAIIQQLNDEKVYDKPVVTTVEPLDVFYAAENYHQNYYNQNSDQRYCEYVIQPKIEKFRKVFKDKLKK